MWLLVLCKLLCELSFYYMSVGILSMVFLAGPYIAVFPFACVLSAFLCWLLRDKPKLIRFLPLVIAVGCYALASFPVDYIFLTPAVFLTIYTVIKKSWYTTHMRFYSFYTKGLIAIIPAVIIILASQVVRARVITAAMFIIVYLFSGATACRLLRHESDFYDDKKFRLMNVISIVALSVSAAVLSNKTVLSSIGKALKFIYSWTLYPILKLLAYIATGFAWLLSKIHITYKGDLHKVYEALNDLSEHNAEEQEVTTSPVGLWFVRLIIVILIAVAIIIIIKIIKNRREPASAALREVRTVEGSSPKKVRAPLFARTPREQVRQAYRKFLILCGKNGVNIPASFSTLETQAAACEQLGPEDNIRELREIYLGARYCDSAEVPEENAEKAKKLSKSIKEKQKINEG